MAWIESHDTLPRHPKTRRLARLLGVPVPQALGHLHLLWWWALGFGHNGMLDGYIAEDVADELMWDGDPTVLVDALLAVGFLDGPPEGPWHVHDWADYAGRLEAKRADDRARAKAYREQRRAGAAGDPASDGGIPDRHPPRAENERSPVREPSEARPQTVRVQFADGTQQSVATVPNRTVPGKREKETAAPATTPDRPRRSVPLPDEAKTLAAELRAALAARGQTVFKRDWDLTSASAAAGLMRHGLTLAECRSLMAWALADPFWGTRITHGKHLADAAPQWQRQVNGAARGSTGPPFQDSPNLAQYLADPEEEEVTHGGH